MKLDKQKGWKALQGRTPPGVRELKPKSDWQYGIKRRVAPLPGCVN